jgi:hypothetical protein
LWWLLLLLCGVGGEEVATGCWGEADGAVVHVVLGVRLDGIRKGVVFVEMWFTGCGVRLGGVWGYMR